MKTKIYNLILCMFVVIVGLTEFSIVNANPRSVSINSKENPDRVINPKVPLNKGVDYSVLKSIKLPISEPAAKKIVPTPVVNKVNIKNMSKEEIKAYICKVFENKCAEALIIANAESGFRANAISRTNDYGVFQLNCNWQKQRVGGDCRKFLDPITNINIAKQIYNEQGWNPWTTKYLLK
jgi:hypothetical protein